MPSYLVPGYSWSVNGTVTNVNLGQLVSQAIPQNLERAHFAADQRIIFVGGTAPASPAAGEAWWDTGDQEFKIYNGTDWISLNESSILQNDRSKVAWSCASSTQVVVASGTTFRGSDGQIYSFAGNQTVDITASGANGLDQGAEGSSRWYAVVAIADSAGANATKGLLVEAANFPGSIDLPTGYDVYARIGWIRNDGSSNFIQGAYFEGKFFFTDAQNVLSGGSQTSFTGVSCVAAMPSTTRIGIFHIQWTVFSGAESAFIRTTGSGSTSGIEVLHTVEHSQVLEWLANTSQSIDYKVSNHNIDINVVGYEDKLENVL